MMTIGVALFVVFGIAVHQSWRKSRVKVELDRCRCFVEPRHF